MTKITSQATIFFFSPDDFWPSDRVPSPNRAVKARLGQPSIKWPLKADAYKILFLIAGIDGGGAVCHACHLVLLAV